MAFTKSFVNGKPMDEWIKEQQEKNGVLTIHRGTENSEWGRSTYNETIVTLGNDRDVCYENASITLKLGGKEYALVGRRVERLSGVWYVDGKRQEHIPTDVNDAMKQANDQLQKDLTDQLNERFGGSIINNFIGSVGSTYIHGKDSLTVKTVSYGRTVATMKDDVEHG